LPVTLGNIVGGGIFVGAIYWYVYIKKENASEAAKKGESTT
jgi:formate/nitrite transporter FocA (FNT family)